MGLISGQNHSEATHPMMLVNDENYQECIEECVEHLGQFMQEHSDHASTFQGIYDGLCALQTAHHDESLDKFDTLLIQQTYGYHFYTMILHTKDHELLTQELLNALAVIEHFTFALLCPCTGIFRVLMDREIPVLEKLTALLGHFQKAIKECEPKESRRLQRALSSVIARLIEATEAIAIAIADEPSMSEVTDAVGDWQNAADEYDAVFVEAFHEHYMPFGCVKGHHLIHEIDKGIANLNGQLKNAIHKELEV